MGDTHGAAGKLEGEIGSDHRGDPSDEIPEAWPRPPSQTG